MSIDPKSIDPDILNLIGRTHELMHYWDNVRSIIDDDPIDLRKLEANLCEGIAAVHRTREASAKGPPNSKDKGFHDLLDGHESYFKTLLTQIRGPGHQACAGDEVTEQADRASHLVRVRHRRQAQNSSASCTSNRTNRRRPKNIKCRRISAAS